MTLTSNFELMAAYNQWMNRSIYEAANSLSAEELVEDRGAFFSSIMGTLNHILVGDTIWLKRFSEHPAKFKALDYVRSLPAPQALSSIPYTNFSELHEARSKMDDMIIGFANELDDGVLSSSLTYSNMKGEPYSRCLGHLVQHFFNHQTHHRGQVSTLLNQSGVDVGVTDLLVKIPCVPAM